MSHVLVITSDVLRKQMAGPAMRAWHIAARLALEHETRLLTTSAYCEVQGEGFEVAQAPADELAGHAHWADILVLQGYVTYHHPALLELDKVLICDVYDPLHLETLALTKGASGPARDWHVQASLETLNRQLARADFLTCATERQRDLFVGQLCAIGRVNPHTYDEDPTLRHLVDVVPFGLPDVEPAHRRPALRGVVPGIGPRDDIIVWAGGVYDWFDPLTLVRAVANLAKKRPSVKLFFMGLKHPNPDVPEMQVAAATKALASELGVAGKHVFFNEGWVAYAERENFLLEATLGVTTHFDTAETRYSFRTRALDYLWAGLPIVTTEGDAFAELVGTEGLGFTVQPEDPEALEDALARLLYDKELAEGCRARSAAVSRRFRWSVVLEPLAEFCRRPRRAPDLVAGAVYGGCYQPVALPPHAGDEAPGGPSAAPEALPVANVGPTTSAEPAPAAPLLPENLAAPMSPWQLARLHYRQGGLGLLARRAAQKAYRMARWHLTPRASRSLR